MSLKCEGWSIEFFARHLRVSVEVRVAAASHPLQGVKVAKVEGGASRGLPGLENDRCFGDKRICDWRLVSFAEKNY